jgi:hypothetical protein
MITAPSIAEPLARLFNYSLRTHAYPSCWKRSNVVPIHKKNSKQDHKNYRPISLLCNVSKVFERIVHNRVYSYLDINNLLTSRNSGFKKGDGTINQLISITDKIYKALDSKSEVRMVCLDLSKAFDRVWHKGLLFKLKQQGITGPLLLWFESYLHDRKQRVIINGQNSEWLPVEAGVPQGSILGPLLFLVFINDIIDNIKSDINLFADDTSLLEIVRNRQDSVTILNNDLKTIYEWALRWLMIFNTEKTVSITFSLKPNPIPQPVLTFNDSPVNEVTELCHLGLTLCSTMKWNQHISNICHRSGQRNSILRKLKFRLPRKTLEKLYLQMIRPILEYCDVIFDGCGTVQSQKLESVQYDAARTCLGALRTTSRKSLLEETGWEPLSVRRKSHKLILYYNILNNLVPEYLRQLRRPTVSAASRYNLRNANNQVTIATRTTRYKDSYLPSSTTQWNGLPLELRNTPTLSSYKRNLNKHLSTQIAPPSWFFSGSRHANILHTRLRLDNPSLNCHLFKFGMSDTCACAACGHPSESTKHFVLECPAFAAPRDIMLATIRDVIAPGTHPRFLLDLDRNHLFKITLRGSAELSHEANSTIFSAVQQFVISTGRFSRS